MGWNDYRLPLKKGVFLAIFIPLAMLGLLPAIIYFVIVQNKKLLEGQCPNCGRQLLLKPGDVQIVKSSWGGAQFFDASGRPVANGKVIARGFKWVGLGLAGLVGLFLVIALLGSIIRRTGLGIPDASSTAAALVGKYGDTDTEYDGRVFREFSVLEGSGDTIKFRLRLVGTDSAGRDEPLDVEMKRLEGVAQFDSGGAQYKFSSANCTVNMKFTGKKVAVQQLGLCGFDSDEAMSTTYEKAKPIRETAQAAIVRSIPKHDRYVSEVRDGVLRSYNTTTIGKAFEATFTDSRWESGESAKGVRFVNFTGRMRPELYKTVFDRSVLRYKEGGSEPPDEIEFSTVRFQFVFAADGNTFSLADFETMHTWRLVEIPRENFGETSVEDVLNYIYR